MSFFWIALIHPIIRLLGQAANARQDPWEDFDEYCREEGHPEEFIEAMHAKLKSLPGPEVSFADYVAFVDKEFKNWCRETGYRP